MSDDVGYVVLLNPGGRAVDRRATVAETQGKYCEDCRRPIDKVRHERCPSGMFGHHYVKQAPNLGS